VPRTCSICTHERRAEIDRALVGGGSLRDIAGRFSLSKSAVERHGGEHLPARLVQAAEAEDVANAIDVVKQLKAINAASLSVLGDARKAGNGDLALKAIDRVQRQIELQAKLLGDLDERPVVTLVTAPEWLIVRAALLDVLQGYPEARTAVAARLVALEAPA
jgi:hypothetical protein